MKIDQSQEHSTFLVRIIQKIGRNEQKMNKSKNFQKKKIWTNEPIRNLLLIKLIAHLFVKYFEMLNWITWSEFSIRKICAK